jgi:hypothetical protein
VCTLGKFRARARARAENTNEPHALRNLTRSSDAVIPTGVDESWLCNIKNCRPRFKSSLWLLQLLMRTASRKLPPGAVSGNTFCLTDTRFQHHCRGIYESLLLFFSLLCDNENHRSGRDSAGRVRLQAEPQSSRFCHVISGENLKYCSAERGRPRPRSYGALSGFTARSLHCFYCPIFQVLRPHGFVSVL